MYIEVKGYWNVKKEKIRLHYPNITEEDLNYHQGKEKEMIEMLGHKLGKTQDEMRNLLVVL